MRIWTAKNVQFLHVQQREQFRVSGRRHALVLGSLRIEVEQPSSSRLIDMPWLRLIIDSIYVKPHTRFHRLLLG